MPSSKTKRNAFKRYGKFMLLKLDKIKATPYAIAAGFACGAAISFTPFVGFHMLLAAITAFLLRGSIIASALGTIVGNPWTFPFIWPAVLFTGRWFLGAHEAGKVDFIRLFTNLMHAVIKLDVPLFVSDIWPILLPMMVGCIPYYILVWAISFYFVKKAMDKFDQRRQRLREQSNKTTGY